MRFFVLFLFFVLFGCNHSIQNPTNIEYNKTALYNWDFELERLKKGTLDKACTEKERLFFKKQIEIQSRHLSVEQMQRSMENMQKDFRCE